jgi:acyl-CoA dehydrogenase
MDFAKSPRTLDIEQRLAAFMRDEVVPRDAEWNRLAHDGSFPAAIVEELKAKARAAGLWNLFLPGLKDDEPGTRLTNLEYAPLAELMGRYPWSSEVFNCNAPDTGNMELLHLFATPHQREAWLAPLLDGSIRSCFAMTEPDVASSDATNVATLIETDGDDYVISGRKWFATGALHPNCKVAIVMGVTNSAADAPVHARHSMVLVPMDSAGLRIVRNLPIYQHLAVEGHCELLFDRVRVPRRSLIGGEGEGFALAQARLGPGRVHHCMRTVGQCEFSLELMCERALQRRAFGKQLSDYANIQDWVAQARVDIDQARLLVLHAAWRMDTQGNKAARIDVSAIKLVAAQLQTKVVDRAIQVFGAAGLTSDTPLSFFAAWARALHFLDGPDEVHLRTIARHELGRVKTELAQRAAA